MQRNPCSIAIKNLVLSIHGLFKFLLKYSWYTKLYVQSVTMSDSLRPHESQHARPPCPSPTPGVYSNSCPSSWWCHPAISSSVIPFSSCPQSLPASESFPMSQLFTRGGQSIGVTGIQYSDEQFLETYSIYSYHKILAIFPMLYSICFYLILHLIVYTSYCPSLYCPFSFPLFTGNH